jgi:periodic tryptophan protein 1
MDPGIELWDLDVADAVEPAAVLGGYGRLSAPDADAALQMARDADSSSSASKGAKKKAKAKAKKAAAKVLAQRPLQPGSHSDAVMALAWNGTFRNVLASGSADCAVKVWDVAACSCAHTLTHHTDKVQALAWNPAEAPVLLSGAFDRTACLVSVL